MPTESAIVQRIMTQLKQLPNTKALKLHGSIYAERGTPDIHITHKGRSYWCEVKQPGCVLTPLQAQRLKEWQDAGATVGVVHSWDEVREVLNV